MCFIRNASCRGGREGETGENGSFLLAPRDFRTKNPFKAQGSNNISNHDKGGKKRQGGGDT